jgi:anti-sigma B factor antagonist
MNVTVVQLEPVTVVAVEGSVDNLTAESLTNALSGHVGSGRVQIVADFSGVQYTSSAGLRSLLLTLKSCRKQGGDFRMAGVQANVLNVLTMAGFVNLIKVYPDVASAVESFAA